MQNNYPDNWVVIKLTGDNPHYRILAGWSGGYTQGSSWRLNSGITGVEKNGENFIFRGHSGSSYICHEDAYQLRMNNAYIWDQLKEKHGELVELMPEETDWLVMDWII